MPEQKLIHCGPNRMVPYHPNLAQYVLDIVNTDSLDRYILKYENGVPSGIILPATTACSPFITQLVEDVERFAWETFRCWYEWDAKDFCFRCGVYADCECEEVGPEAIKEP